MRPERIVLTGFMGAGKSTVGRLLALRLGWSFVDADDEISRLAGLDVPEIFARHGETHFRGMEAQTIAALLTRSRAVIALGGGALEDELTRARIAGADGTLLVYLKVSLSASLERCLAHAGGTVRPLLGDSARLAQRFERRLAGYAQAHLTFDTDGIAPPEIVEQIAEAVEREGARQPF